MMSLDVICRRFGMNIFKWLLVFSVVGLLFGCDAHKVTHKLEFNGIKHHVEIEKHHVEKIESHETHKETIKA